MSEDPYWQSALRVARTIADDVQYATYEHTTLEIARAILKAREEERAVLFDRLSAQLGGWDRTPPEEGENYGSMALANALWQIFPEFQSQLQEMKPAAIRQHSQKGGEND